MARVDVQDAAVGGHDPQRADVVAGQAERSGREAVATAEREPCDADGRAGSGRDRHLSRVPEPLVDVAELRSCPDRRGAPVRCDRHRAQPRDVDDEPAGGRRVAAVAVAAAARRETDAVPRRPADAARDVLRALAVRDRERPDAVEARVPEEPRGRVARRAASEDVAAELPVERADARVGALEQCGQPPPRGHRGGQGEAPAALDEPTTVEPFHDRRLRAWRRRRPSGSCSSTASGSRPASGWRCARRTPTRRSHGSRRQAPRKRAAPSTPPSARCASRCRHTSGRRFSSASPERSADVPTRSPGRSPRRPASRSKAARVEVAQGDVDVHDVRGRGAQARRRGRADGGHAGGRGQARLHAACSRGRRRRHLAVQLPAQPRRAQDRAGARRRVRRGAQAGVADAALGAPARGARVGSGPPARLAQRPRRPGGRDRRRARRGRARPA